MPGGAGAERSWSKVLLFLLTAPGLVLKSRASNGLDVLTLRMALLDPSVSCNQPDLVAAK
jgi:hypothetical protein